MMPPTVDVDVDDDDGEAERIMSSVQSIQVSFESGVERIFSNEKPKLFR